MRFSLIVLAIAIVALLSPGGSHATQFDYMVEDPQNNGNGTYFPFLWGVQPRWVFDGASLHVCSDWGPTYSAIPLPVRQAISEWETVLPGTQFSPTCTGASSSQLWLRRRSASSGFPINKCGGHAGCVPFNFTYDSVRQANYPMNTVWFDDVNYSFTDEGLQQVTAHELGHVFGLHDVYIENPGGDVDCNDTVNSVMDASLAPGNVVTGPCAGDSSSPTQRDIDLVEAFYEAQAPTAVPAYQNGTVGLAASFFDGMWSESGYQFYAYFWNGADWDWNGYTWPLYDGVGHKDNFNNTTYSRSAGDPPGIYRVCMTVLSGIYGADGWVCSSAVYLSIVDAAAEYITLLGPPSIHLSDTQGRDMWVAGGMSNLGDGYANIPFSLDITSDLPSGCTRTVHMVLPGQNPFLLLSGELKPFMYRVHYECHAPAPPNVYTEILNFDVQLPFDENIWNDSTSDNKQVSVEIDPAP